ncbi:MAG: hypothetical protein AAFU67_10660, partial [Bacteroidota bacterium]
QANNSLAELQGTLESANEALGGLTVIMEGLADGRGTLGKLIADDGIYQRLSNISNAADTLLIDLQQRPYRYVPFKSRRRVLKFDRKDEELRTKEAVIKKK